MGDGVSYLMGFQRAKGKRGLLWNLRITWGRCQRIGLSEHFTKNGLLYHTVLE